MALRRRTTPMRPVEKAGAACYVAGAVLYVAVLIAGGPHGAFRKTVWLFGAVLFLAGVVCQVITSATRNRDQGGTG
jgi:hypothetical protein